MARVGYGGASYEGDFGKTALLIIAVVLVGYYWLKGEIGGIVGGVSSSVNIFSDKSAIADYFRETSQTFGAVYDQSKATAEDRFTKTDQAAGWHPAPSVTDIVAKKASLVQSGGIGTLPSGEHVVWTPFVGNSESGITGWVENKSKTTGQTTIAPVSIRDLSWSAQTPTKAPQSTDVLVQQKTINDALKTAMQGPMPSKTSIAAALNKSSGGGLGGIKIGVNYHVAPSSSVSSQKQAATAIGKAPVGSNISSYLSKTKWV